MLRTANLTAVAVAAVLAAPGVAGAQINGAHATLFTPPDFANDANRQGSMALPRVIYDQDTWLSQRSHSLYMFHGWGLWNPARVNQQPLGSPWFGLGWDDIPGSEAAFYFGCPGPSCSWDSQPCDVPGDEVWLSTHDPAHLDTPVAQVTEGWNVPSWHSLRRISPCTNEPDQLTYFSPSQPFVDGPTGNRVFAILDQSDAYIFPRYRIQFKDNRALNMRWFSPNGWETLFELDRDLWGDQEAMDADIQLLHVACPNVGTAVHSGSAVSKFTWNCLFNFTWKDGNGLRRPSVGHMRIEFDSTKSDPYRVWVKNELQQMILLPLRSGVRTLEFKPYEDPQFFDGWRGRGYVPQQIVDRANGTQEVWMTLFRSDGLADGPCSTVAYGKNGGGLDATAYLASWTPSTFVMGTRSPMTKSTSAAPPGSTVLPASPDSPFERFTVSYARVGNAGYVFSGSKHDPHRNGQPYLCSRFTINAFEGMSIVAEPSTVR